MSMMRAGGAQQQQSRGGESGGHQDENTVEALQKYSSFVEEVLKPQLTQTLAKRDEISREMLEYQELLELIRDLQTKQLSNATQEEEEEMKGDASGSQDAKATQSLHVLMDLGQKFQVRAKITDPSMITIDIGLNFHVEMTLDEARQFVNRHLLHLTQYVHLLHAWSFV